MANSKIDFSFENLHFSCEGENLWVERQLNNVLSRIPSLLAVHKKGENIVEEVIDIREEEMSEVPVNTSGERVSKPAKSSKKTIRGKKTGHSKVAKDRKEAKMSTVHYQEPVSTALYGENSNESKTVKIKEPKSEKSIAKSKKGNKISVKKDLVKTPESKSSPIGKNVVDERIDSPLSRFLMENKADKNQVRKFLATAVFLSKSNNVNILSTPMISKALKSYGISRLQNASDCLNKNCKKGNCVKEGKEFAITEAGYLAF